MKTVVIIVFFVIDYAILGYVFATCCKAWDGDYTFDDEIYVSLGAFWIIVLPILLLYLIAKFIGKKLAVVPVAIITLIRIRKEAINEKGIRDDDRSQGRY